MLNKEFTKNSYEWYNAASSVKVIAKSDELMKYVYPALRKGNYVYIALYNPMSVSQAGAIVKAEILDTYTYTQAIARTVITSNGYTLQSLVADPYHTSGKTNGVFLSISIKKGIL